MGDIKVNVENRRSDKLLLVAGIGVLIISMMMNVVMLRRNRTLGEWVEAYRSRLVIPKGVRLPTIQGRDLAGKPIAIDFEKQDHPTILFVFSPSCNVCTANWPKWDLILQSRPNTNWRAIFVNMGSPTTSEYRQLHALNHYSVVESLATESILAYRLFQTPETILLSREGKVIFSWEGAITDDVGKSLFAKLISTQ